MSNEPNEFLPEEENVTVSSPETSEMKARQWEQIGERFSVEHPYINGMIGYIFLAVRRSVRDEYWPHQKAEIAPAKTTAAGKYIIPRSFFWAAHIVEKSKQCVRKCRQKKRAATVSKVKQL